MARIQPVLAIVAFGLAAGCANGSQPEALQYACRDYRFTVQFVGDTAVVVIPDATLRLPLALSASGARYSVGTNTIWEHQGEVRLELADTTFDNCVPVEGD